MSVLSFNFLLFFIVVFVVYYLPFLRSRTRYQNLWILLSSYFFYAQADWRMVLLLIVATTLFYFIGLWLKREMISHNVKRASCLTTLGVSLGIGLLLYFKYLNFFGESFAALFSGFGLKATWVTLNIVVPIGVSFFTFKLISYIIEIHREHIAASDDFIEFATYVAFFPTLLSGPIDRPNSLIPQFRKARNFDYANAVDGCRQILWGLFTKICIADSLANATEYVWSDYENQTGSTLLLWALLYTMQIYTDFDGYSNIAIGIGKLLNIKVTRNFKQPLLARNIAEFWRNWHMSLTSWITDYVFLPLNIKFRNLGQWGVLLAVFINIVLIGLWHGANWTFAMFGVYHAILYVPLVLSGSFGKNKKLRSNRYGLPKANDFLKMCLNYLFVSLGFIVFFASSLTDAISFAAGFFDVSLFSLPILPVKKVTLLFILVVLGLEWYQRGREYALQFEAKGLFRHAIVRFLLYQGILLLIFWFVGKTQSFIYYQF